MGILDSLTQGIKASFQKRKEERENLQRLQQEADAQRLRIFNEEFRQNSLEVVTRKAKEDANKLSGLQKLRALNRARRLTEPSSSFFSKMSQFTQKNIARREENIKRTEELRKEAKKMREDKLTGQQKLRQGRVSEGIKPFNRGSTWKM